MLTDIVIDSYVIDYVIVDNGIRTIQILLSMPDYQLAKMASLKKGDVNTILRLQWSVQWYQKQSNRRLPNWKYDFNYDVFYEYFMDDKSDPDLLLGDLKSQTSAGKSTSTA